MQCLYRKSHRDVAAVPNNRDPPDLRRNVFSARAAAPFLFEVVVGMGWWGLSSGSPGSRPGKKGAAHVRL